MTAIRRLVLGLAAIALFLLAVVAVNQEQVSIRFLVWRTPEWSLFWWLLIAFFIGAGVGALCLLPSRAKGARTIRQLRRQLQKVERQSGKGAGAPSLPVQSPP